MRRVTVGVINFFFFVESLTLRVSLWSENSSLYVGIVPIHVVKITRIVKIRDYTKISAGPTVEKQPLTLFTKSWKKDFLLVRILKINTDIGYERNQFRESARQI